MLPFLPALISAGATLFAANSAKKQQDKAFKQDEKNYQRNDLVKTMKDAQDAGFHPLEALRAGYTQSQVAQAPRISSVSVAANAVDQISAIYRDDLQRKTNDALIEAQIANINADTARMGNISQNSVRLASSGAAAAASAPSTPQAGDDIYGNKQTAGFQTNPDGGWETDPNTSDAEVLEQRYGEAGSFLGGVGIFGRDLGHNLYKANPMFWQNGNTEIRPPRLSTTGGVGDFNYIDPSSGFGPLGGTTK